MLVIDQSGERGNQIADLGYVHGTRPWSRPLLALTRWLRARNAERYMGPAERHLDIGCGDGYFLRRSPCRERYGLDSLLGDHVTDRLDFPSSHFDYVTMLAVIEHIPEPRRLVIEIARVLRPGGRLIMTTPKSAADALIRLYVSDIDEQHETYFDARSLAALCEPELVLLEHHRFILGLNQAFCFEAVKPE